MSWPDFSIRRGGAVLAGALLMTWPALYNRYPLLFPDSMSYMEDGPLVARALLLHKYSADYGGRSFIYCLGILPLHWNVTPWPIVALNAILTAYVLWLVVRSVLPRHAVAAYLSLILPLSAFTSLGWFVSLVMPDILAGVLCLSVYLLIFGRESLSRRERVGVTLIAWWAVASHITHLMLAFVFCVLLVALALLWKSLRRWLSGVAEVTVIVCVAAGAHLALHAFLYGEPSLNGKRPPFLMARVIVDGPGRWYLQQHCGALQLTICQYLPRLPNDDDEFLWKLDGIWQTASPGTKERLRREEMGFVVRTVRAYPRAVLSTAAANFWNQLLSFGLWDYGPSTWVSNVFEKILPGARPRYLRSRQAERALPDEFSSSAQEWTVLASLVLIGVLIPLLWRRRPSSRLIGFAALAIFVVIANAFLTGVLSNVEDRYQSRVIWLLPLLAGLALLELMRGRDEKDQRRGRKGTERQTHEALGHQPLQLYSAISGWRVATRYRPEWNTSGSPSLYLYSSTSPRRMT